MTRAEIIESLNCLRHYADTQVCAENDKLELEAAEAYKDMREHDNKGYAGQFQTKHQCW